MGTGASLVLKRRFSASGFLGDVREYRCTFTSTIGRALTYILATPETEHDKDHELRFLLASRVLDRGHEGVQASLRSRRSSVATARARTPSSCHRARASRAEALGVPAPGLDVAVVDPATNEECPPAASTPTAGCSTSTRPSVSWSVGTSLDRFEGYYNNDEATARAHPQRAGTGRAISAYRDEDGIFYFAGRNADWLRVDGENFSGGARRTGASALRRGHRGGGVRGARRPHRSTTRRWR